MNIVERMSYMKVDPFLVPVFGYRNKLARVLWWCGCMLFFRFSPKPFFAWRRVVLRVFGARIGPFVNIYPRAKIWAPWNLVCHEMSSIANDAEIYNCSKVLLESHAIVSQGAYLCCASHDYNNPKFYFFSKPITLKKYSWVCARASVLPGVILEEGAVLGLGSVATKNLEAWTVYVGLPAKAVKERTKTV